MRLSGSLVIALAAWGWTSGSAVGQVFDQGPVQTRTFRNPEVARAASGEAHGVETEDVFGFTLGSDTEEQGAMVLEAENVTSFGSRNQSYVGINSKIQFTYGVTSYFTASLGLLGGYWGIKNRGPDYSTTNTGEIVPTEYAYPEGSNYRFAGIGGEFRLNLLKRRDNFVGLTLHAEPSFRLADEVTGERGNGFGGTVRNFVF